MRRFSLCTAIVLLLCLAAPAVGQDTPSKAETTAPAKAASDVKSDIVKAAQGLVYTKPSGWVPFSGERGAVSTLKRSGDDKTQIEFRFAPVVGAGVDPYFAKFHSSLRQAKLERVSSNGKTFGTLDGRISEYKMGTKIPRSIVVFEFATPSGAWLVVGMFDARTRDKQMETFSALLETVKFSN